MKSIKKIVLMILIMLILIIGIMFFLVYRMAKSNLSNNITLDTNNYLTNIEIKSKSNFMLFINKKKKISNIIFLNGESVSSLYKKDIENKNIKEGIMLIIDNLKNNDEFDNTNEFRLISYGNDEVYNLVKEEVQKQFVIYGINNNIVEGQTTLKERVDNRYNSDDEILKNLYNGSLDIIFYNQNNNSRNTKISENKISDYAVNVYKKLESYSIRITEQAKDSDDAMDITTLNATSDYTNQLYATANSWYYVSNGTVFAYIQFKYKEKTYNYCFNGNEVFTVGYCQ